MHAFNADLGLLYVIALVASPSTCGRTTDRSAAAAAHAVDLAAVSFRRAAGTAVTHGKRGLEGVVSFGWGRAVIVKALGSECGIDSLRDEFGDVDDPLALVDACFHVIARSHW
jgi:hypothetical protein